MRSAATAMPITPTPEQAETMHLILAPAAFDATGLVAAPAALLHDGVRVVAVGAPESVGGVPAARVTRLEREVVTPAFANAHTHLDLTHLGTGVSPSRSQEIHDRDAPIEFTAWAESIRTGRLTAPAEIAASVRLGIGLSLAGGVAAVGDIAGARSLVPAEELRASELRGVSFVEIFGHGRRQQAAMDFLDHLVDVGMCDDTAEGVRIGFQPHAPYSCGPRVYRHAGELARRQCIPLSTHLAETQAELEFVRHGTGPFADMLRRIGVWDDSISGIGQHPIDAMEAAFAAAPWIAAHVNHLDPRHVDMLAALDVTVAFCPRTHRFFGHHRDRGGPHRWRDMIAAGVPVAICTDGLPSIDSPERITPFDDARMLFAQVGGDAAMLLRAITTVPAAALGLDPDDFLLRGGAAAGLLAVTTAGHRATDSTAPLTGDGSVRWLAGPWRSSASVT